MPTSKKTTTKSGKTGQTQSRSATSQVTTDHEEIRRWAEERQGQPACVKGTGSSGDIGVLRIDFPGGEEEKLQKIAWGDWFDKFDERNLAFLFQEKTAGGQTSRFNKIVSKDTAEGEAGHVKRPATGGKTRTAGH